MDLLRVGKISAVNYDEGKCRVVYSDRDDATTVELPLIVFNNEYYVPEVDDQCIVLHQPNGAASAFILGDFWSKTHDLPDQTGEGIRTKYFDRDGKCYWTYDDPDNGEGNEGTLELHNDDKIEVDSDDNIKMNSDKEFEIKGANKVKVNSDGSIEIEGSGTVKVKSGGSLTIEGGSVTISNATKIDGITFITHTHECTAPGSPSGPPQGA